MGIQEVEEVGGGDLIHGLHENDLREDGAGLLDIAEVGLGVEELQGYRGGGRLGDSGPDGSETTTPNDGPDGVYCSQAARVEEIGEEGGGMEARDPRSAGW